MAEKISVQIALEGGAEVARQLEDIGAAGQNAFNKLAQSAEQVGGFKNLKTDEVTAGLKAAGVEGKELTQILKAVGTAVRFEKLVQGVESVQAAFSALGRAAGPVGLAIAAGMQAAAKATIAFANTIGKASDQAVKLGLSLEQLKQHQRDFEKLGVSAQDAASGLAQFQKEMEKAIAQADPGSNLRLFGNAVQMAQQQMGPFIERLRQMPDGIERTNLAIQNFGPAGLAMIQNLRRAEGSMTSAEAKAYDLGQAIERLGARWAEFGSVQFAPALTAGINAVAAAVDALNQRMQTNPFLAWVQVASFLNPIHAAIQLIISAIGSLASSLAGDIWGSFAQAAVTSWDQVVSAVQAAGSAIAGFISSLTGITWDSISSGATTAWNAVTTAIQGAGTAISNFVSQLGSITWDAISSAGVAAWDALTAAIQSAIDKLRQFIGLKPSAPATGGGATGKARGGLIGGRGSGTSDSNLAWLSRGEHVMPAHVVRRPGMLSFLESLRRGGGIPGFAAGGSVITADIPVSGKMSGLINSLVGATDKIQQVIETIRNFTNTIVINLQDVQFQVLKVANDLANRNFARGGLLGGRGTGTSDSNLAWVSRGEYITPARAVAQPGVLAFLEALRRSGGNLSAVLDGMGRFTLGGLVPRPAYAFAAGGQIGSMSNVTINFPGLQPISGLRASDAVVDELRKAAALAQVRSGGRKPSRYS